MNTKTEKTEAKADKTEKTPASPKAEKVTEMRTMDQLSPEEQVAHQDLIEKRVTTGMARNRKLAQAPTKQQQEKQLQKMLKKSIQQNRLAPTAEADLSAKAGLIKDLTSGKKRAKAESRS